MIVINFGKIQISAKNCCPNSLSNDMQNNAPLQLISVLKCHMQYIVIENKIDGKYRLFKYWL